MDSPTDHTTAGADTAAVSSLSPRVPSLPVYLGVFIALLFFTGLTVWVATLDLGSWAFLHTPLALTIAVCKGMLVALFFMHLRDSERLTGIFIAVGLIWLVLLIGLTMGDYVTRARDAQPSTWQLDASAAAAPPSDGG
ncbi:MAG: cytochrome C oxidase subunit IV family protein [Acidobacteriota bacterium]|jgi:caa(3)-type oxidase subunit IV